MRADMAPLWGIELGREKEAVGRPRGVRAERGKGERLQASLLESWFGRRRLLFFFSGVRRRFFARKAILRAPILALLPRFSSFPLAPRGVARREIAVLWKRKWR